MTTLSNIPYEELSIGQTASRQYQVSQRDIALFAAVSGDINPLHLDHDYAATTAFGGCIAHGMLSGAYISAAIAMDLPGPGTVYVGQQMDFRAPVKPGDTLTITLEVLEKQDRRHRVILGCEVRNQDNKRVVTGTATVIAPREKLFIPAPATPAVQVQ